MGCDTLLDRTDRLRYGLCDDSIHLNKSGVSHLIKIMKSYIHNNIQANNQHETGSKVTTLLPQRTLTLVGLTHIDISMINGPSNARESCTHCEQHNFTHNPIIICPTCDKIVHGKCADKQFKVGKNGKWYCCKCAEIYGIKRYNLFSESIDFDTEHDYDAEPANSIDCIAKISNILDTCRSFNLNEINSKLNCNDVSGKQLFSNLFTNIDGNATNFDEFATELQLYNNTFSVIGLAEPNICESQKDMYPLTNYTSIHQSKISDKKKGSGVGLYIHNSYNFTHISEHSISTPNIENLFITITNTESPTTIGVVYRPPNGQKTKFINELEGMIKQLPDKNVYIMGDCNINIHNLKSNDDVKFEDDFISSGFAPLISISTHEQPGCEKTCIDNIFCFKVLFAGDRVKKARAL